MSHSIFQPARIGTIELQNKIIRSATHEGMADENGYPTEALQKKYIQLAKGEAGAIITGYAGVSKRGKAPLLNMLMIDTDEAVDHYKKLVNAVHEYDTPIILQIAHCGRQTRSALTGWPTEAPSAIRDSFYNEDMPIELSESQIQLIIDEFVSAIVRAKEAGFDGVQIHGAHGYLISEFLSPHMNRRKDKWGGCRENRFRIVAEILKKAREIVGDYPILIKINGHEGPCSGVKKTLAAEYAHMLEVSRCSGIEVSCGIGEDNFNTCRCQKIPMDQIFKYTFRFKNTPPVLRPIVKFFANIFIPKHKPLTGYNIPSAALIKARVSIPVIVVGGFASVHDISEAFDTKSADFVAMSRPFILEPDIVKKFREQKQEKSKCLYCNYCFIATEEKTLRCYYGKVK